MVQESDLTLFFVQGSLRVNTDGRGIRMAFCNGCNSVGIDQRTIDDDHSQAIRPICRRGLDMVLAEKTKSCLCQEFPDL